MTGYTLSVEADQDFTDIYEYSIYQFGMAQADEYAGNLIATFELIAERPKSAPMRNDLVYGLRCRMSGSHAAYYLQDENGNVLIVRILHQSMDAKQHL